MLGNMASTHRPGFTQQLPSAAPTANRWVDNGLLSSPPTSKLQFSASTSALQGISGDAIYYPGSICGGLTEVGHPLVSVRRATSLASRRLVDRLPFNCSFRGQTTLASDRVLSFLFLLIRDAAPDVSCLLPTRHPWSRASIPHATLCVMARHVQHVDSQLW